MELPPPAYEDVVAAARRPRPPYLRQESLPEEMNQRLVVDISCLKDSTLCHLPRLKKLTSELDNSYSRLKSSRAKIDRALFDWRKTLIQMIDQCYEERVTKVREQYEGFEHKLVLNRDQVSDTYNSARQLCLTASDLADCRNQYSLQMLKRRFEKTVAELGDVVSDEDVVPRENFATWCLETPDIGVEEIEVLVGTIKAPTAPVSESRRPEPRRNEPQIPPPGGGTGTGEHAGEDGTDGGEVTTAGHVESETPSAPPMTEQHEPIKYTLQHKIQTKTYKDKARCHPLSFAVDFDGNIIVADKFNQKLKVFTQRGQLIREVVHPHMRSPTYVALTLSGDIAVSDADSGDIKFFSSNGDLQGNIALGGTPAGISFNLMGDLIVVDTSNKSLVISDATVAKVKSTIRQYTLEVPVNAYTNDHRMTTVMQERKFNFFEQPHYVTVGHNDDIFVSDRAANTVQMFDKDGGFTWRAGARGGGRGHFNGPYGITISPDDAIVVADYNNHRIQKMNPLTGHCYDPLLTPEDGIRFPTSLAFTADEKLMVAEYLTGEIKIFSKDGTDEEEEILPPAYFEAVGQMSASVVGGAVGGVDAGGGYPYDVIGGDYRTYHDNPLEESTAPVPAWETTI